MRILVVNCNTSDDVTDAIDSGARAAASAGTEIRTIQPAWGPSSAEGFLESFMTAAAVIDAVSRETAFDAVVMAGYGEHGREGVRQLVEVPVVDVTEASAYLAALVSDRFAVVTTMSSTIPGIRESLHTAGALSRCSAISATETPVLSIHADSPAAVEALAEAAAPLIEAGADSVVLGCAGYAGLDRDLEARLGVPVLDGVASAVAVAEALVKLGKRTSKRGPFAPIDPRKKWIGWSPFPEAAATGVV
ncbi:aspartate/glutamate racemase family protein [Demequina zhanjiangensis]|uniref:Aspartate/glutamate racemase family protein n=1 Tax=Demequina zhanjiangensis TaxID=3051659 RepID=A0ABT8FZC3_9MICO|nr:aspartate/glutamate racemase family protein [Demequina sp. SYSU T00b26]MDN4472243.1 aspartate/glutamate racemase family protein [Demequina sp. SYSU T00b26]